MDCKKRDGLVFLIFLLLFLFFDGIFSPAFRIHCSRKPMEENKGNIYIKSKIYLGQSYSDNIKLNYSF